MANQNYMERTMDQLMRELERLDAAKTPDEVALAASHAKSVVAVATKVFDGQRANNETVRLRGALGMVTHASTTRAVSGPPLAASTGALAAPYYERKRKAEAECDAAIEMEALYG